MVASEATLFRAVTARLNFLAIDRTDIQYSVKEATRKMANPVTDDWQIVNRIGRYLTGKPRVVHLYRWQDAPTGLDSYVDSNWAGCPPYQKEYDWRLPNARQPYDPLLFPNTKQGGTVKRRGRIVRNGLGDVRRAGSESNGI